LLSGRVRSMPETERERQRDKNVRQLTNGRGRKHADEPRDHVSPPKRIHPATIIATRTIAADNPMLIVLPP
jgi:hypothetical protein